MSQAHSAFFNCLVGLMRFITRPVPVCAWAGLGYIVSIVCVCVCVGVCVGVCEQSVPVARMSGSAPHLTPPPPHPQSMSSL